MKTLKTILCGLGLLLAPALQAQDDWTLKSPAMKPSARHVHAMASLGGDQVLLFSGRSVGYNDETWVYDLSDNTWTQKSLATKPSARYGHKMASLGGDQVLLFGGNDGSSNVNYDETWVYDLSDNTWTLKSPATKPSARLFYAMASLGGDQVLLFGGQGDDGVLDDETWVYDLSDNIWTLKSPATKPSTRYVHAMASLDGGQVLLFGGYVGGNGNDGALDDETWVYDLSDNTWTLKSPATKPSAREDHAMASLEGGNQVLLFGGNHGSSNIYDDETWVYDLSDNIWTLKSPATKPSARLFHAMASLGSEQVLLFGGIDGGSKYDDTWVYTATPSPPTSIALVFLAEDEIFLDRHGASEGNIHANNDIVIRKGAPSTLTGNLTAVDNITIAKSNTVNGVATATHQIDIASGSVVTGGTNPNTPVAVVSLPNPSFSAGGPNHTIPQNGSLTLGPGSYGNVVVGKNATLNLSAGDYFFKTLDAKQGADLAIDVSGGEVGINVVTKLTFGKQVEVVISSGDVDSRDVTFCSRQSSQLSIGEQARVLGSIIAPKATVVLSKNSRFRGSVCADQVKVSQGAVFLHHSSDDSLPKQDAPDLEDIDSEEEIVSVISDYELSANYPNPFNPNTTIKFAMPEAARVTLRIYSLTGQLVSELVNGEVNGGRHLMSWNGRNHAGAPVASGIYFYRLEAQKQNGEAAFMQTRRMVLVK